MTPEERLRMFLLEEAIEACKNKIEFLHGCLTDPHIDGVSGGYEYAYPDMTFDLLKRISSLVPDRDYCFHSKTDRDCESCADRNERFHRKAQLMKDAGVEDV
jgi:hypothetical protein